MLIPTAGSSGNCRATQVVDVPEGELHDDVTTSRFLQESPQPVPVFLVPLVEVVSVSCLSEGIDVVDIEPMGKSHAVSVLIGSVKFFV